MKKLLIIIVVSLISGISTSFSQDNDAKAKSGKTNQADLYNNFYLSCGIGSIYYFIDNEGATANTTSGTFLLGYSRSLNKVVTVGFQLTYTNFGRSQQQYSYPDYSYKYDVNDNLWQGLATLHVHYLNRSSFSMYSGFGMGVTMDMYTKTNTSTNNYTKGQKLFPATQLTLLGFRVGRAFSFFGEFGVGTNSIINAGISYKFGDND